MTIKRTIYPVYLRIPDISTASLGARIRYLRKRLGYTITSLATMTELGHNTIAKFERDEMKSIKPWVLGRMLPFLLAKFKEVFPDAIGDIDGLERFINNLTRWATDPQTSLMDDPALVERYQELHFRAEERLAADKAAVARECQEAAEVRRRQRESA